MPATLAAAEDFLANGLPGRAQKTVTKNKDAIEPILAVIGGRKIRELPAADVDKARPIPRAVAASSTVYAKRSTVGPVSDSGYGAFASSA